MLRCLPTLALPRSAAVRYPLVLLGRVGRQVCALAELLASKQASGCA